MPRLEDKVIIARVRKAMQPLPAARGGLKDVMGQMIQNKQKTNKPVSIKTV